MSALDSWTRGSHTYDGRTHPTWRKGTGPGVVVVHEIPGITDAVVAFAEEVVAAGHTVVMPQLFGEAGGAVSLRQVATVIPRVCISREFTKLARNETTPVAGWLRSLARDLHAELGGPGVGALGMCFTGGFALAMMVDDRLIAPVLSQPSLPFPVGGKRKRDLGISDGDLARVKERAAAGQCVLGLRFTNDIAVPKERFQRLREELGDRFLAVEIDSSPGNAAGIVKNAHSVLTEHLVDEPGHPTREALDRVLAFYRERLLPS
jgi:dienelactone hydrolase